MKINAVIAAAILAFTSGTSAHLVLSNPIPFSGGNQDPLNLETGADFPCGIDMANGYTVGTMNTWEAGSTQEVSFLGTAVHSGGSCQFAFSTDTKPGPQSSWKVIHSVIGGCPMNAPDGVSGNAEKLVPGVVPSASWPIPDKFPVEIPKDTPNGPLTFAWIWFNKTGNREMYMKCAPVTITGGADSTDTFNARPEIFKANIVNGCNTVEGVNVNFPNPGDSVESRGTVAGDGFTGSCGGSGGAAAPAPAAPAPAAPAPATGGASCSADGAMICFSATEFGICNGGSAVPQAVAAGTTCSNGAIVRRSVKPARRHAKSLLRRHIKA
jgi:hypothetical protein